MNAEGDEIELSEVELQKWIRAKVEASGLISHNLLEKCQVLQSLLERRKDQAGRFLQLCESVSAYEAILKEQYSRVGLEYGDMDSEDDGEWMAPCDPTDCDSPLQLALDDTSQSPRQSSGAQLHALGGDDAGPPPRILRKPVVVLTKLPDVKDNSAYSLPSPDYDSGDDALYLTNSDNEWKPEGNASDSDCSVSNFVASSKKRKLKQMPKEKRTKKRHETLKSAAETHAAAFTAAKTDASTVDTQDKTDSGALETLSRPATTEAIDKPLDKPTVSATVTSTNITTDGNCNKSCKDVDEIYNNMNETCKSADQTDKNTDQTDKNTGKTDRNMDKTDKNTHQTAKNTGKTDKNTNQTDKNTGKTDKNTDKTDKTIHKNTDKTSNKPTNEPTNEPTAATTTNKPPWSVPSMPPGEVTVNMAVLGRKKHMVWEKGQILEILTKHGKLRYKVYFEDKSKMLLSGHHIAFGRIAQVEQLCIGGRVVINYKTEQPAFCPGVIAELPSRKNRMRFLVFIDDHTPVYVGLPRIHLVCRPLSDPVGDIPDTAHRQFVEDYLKFWPYPLQTQYEKGKNIKAEYEGAQQKCSVCDMDCSLIEVVFEKDQHKEWIYRGSMRLEHMINMRELMEQEKAQKTRSSNSTQK